eukprot:Seg878.8 transcript_id=Seg878.8/GoldUCD/mRNA.D3Y31 product="Coiled-coil domain-containing protein 6" protein_id=Seg878.8/GoldUCD/D3Y31
MAANSLNSSSEALPASDSDMSADESQCGLKPESHDGNRIASLHQENRVLKMELEMFKLRTKSLQEENKALRQASVSIQAKAEQEEEFISNTLMKKIQALKKEKEILAMNYEQEEEYLTNDLSKKLCQLRNEKAQLEQTLEQEQEFQVNKLIRKIERLEAETMAKQTILEQLRKEKVDLENALEQEQESLVNRLWKKMEKLEKEKRLLQEKLEQPVSEPPSPRRTSEVDVDDLSLNVSVLREEVSTLRDQLRNASVSYNKKMMEFEKEEHQLKEENIRLQRKLFLEMERREALSRQLSESESSLEMDEERHFNELAAQGAPIRDRAISSPIPYPSQPQPHRPKSPAAAPPPHGHGFTAFTPPSPRGGRLSSGSGTGIGQSPPFIQKQSSFSNTSPKLKKKSQRPLSGH